MFVHSSKYLAVFVAFSALALSPAMATPLARDACQQLNAERQGMVKRGVRKSLQKGPEWASKNLQPTQMQLVGKYLKLEAVIRFQCGKAGAPRSKVASKKRTVKFQVPLPVRNSKRVKQKRKAALEAKKAAASLKAKASSAAIAAKPAAAKAQSAAVATKEAAVAANAPVANAAAANAAKTAAVNKPTSAGATPVGEPLARSVLAVVGKPKPAKASKLKTVKKSFPSYRKRVMLKKAAARRLNARNARGKDWRQTIFNSY